MNRLLEITGKEDIVFFEPSYRNHDGSYIPLDVLFRAWSSKVGSPPSEDSDYLVYEVRIDEEADGVWVRVCQKE